MRGSWRRNSFLILAGVLAALLIAEGLLQAAFYVALSRYDGGIEKALYQPASDPGLVYELRPGASFQRYQTNSRGFRDEERSLTKPPSTFRILSLGDSVAFGLGVEFAEAYPRVLERLLADRRPFGERFSKYEVVNLAVFGYNTAQERILLERTGLAYAPDLVLVGFVFNDHFPPPRYDPRGVLILPEHTHVWYVNLLRRSQLLTFLGQAARPLFATRYQSAKLSLINRDSWEHMKDELRH